MYSVLLFRAKPSNGEQLPSKVTCIFFKKKGKKNMYSVARLGDE